MSSGRRTLAKNASVMLVSQLITWAIALLLALYLPRYLQPEALGQFAIAGSIWAIVSVFLTFGMDTFLTKSIARDPSKTSELLATSLITRTWLFAIGCVVVWLYVRGFNYGPEVQSLTAIVAVGTYIGLLNAAFTAALNGLERMEFVSLASVIVKGVTAVLCFLCILFGLKVFWIAGVGIVAMTIGLGIVAAAFLRLYPLSLRFSLAAALSMLRLSAPYLITGMTLVVYLQVDQLLIAKLVDAKAVGYYSTAQTLFGTLLFLPGVFGTVVFPMLARNHTNSQDQMAGIIRRTIDLMFLVSIPIGFGVAVTAEPLVLLVYGSEFFRAGQILSVFGIACIFTYLNTLLGQLLISIDRTARLNILMIIAVVATIPLDLLLVPWCERMFQNGALGCALSSLITESCMLVVSLLLLPKQTLAWSNVRTAGLLLVSGVAMVGTTLWLRDSSLVLAIALGAVTYIGMVLLLRVLPKSDWQLMIDGVRAVIARLRARRGTPAQAHGD